jgi:hypothetical protein
MLLRNPFTSKGGKEPTAQPELGGKKSGVVPAKSGEGEITDKGVADDPLMKFEELWQPNLDAKGQPVVTRKGPKAYMPNLDPKKMGEFVSKMDFTKHVKPEQLQAISKGGDEALPHLMELLNSVGRQSFAHAFTGLQRMSEAGIQAAIADARADIPNFVADQMLESGLESSNPLMKNPAFQPLVKQVKDQYRQKFPKATPAEIQTAVNGYFEKLHQEVTGTKAKAEPQDTNNDLLKAGSPDADWGEWFDLEPAPVEGATGDTPNQPVTQ